MNSTPCRLCAKESLSECATTTYAAVISGASSDDIVAAERAGRIVPFCTLACAVCGNVAAFSYEFHCTTRGHAYASRADYLLHIAARIRATTPSEHTVQ